MLALPTLRALTVSHPDVTVGQRSFSAQPCTGTSASMAENSALRRRGESFSCALSTRSVYAHAPHLPVSIICRRAPGCSTLEQAGFVERSRSPNARRACGACAGRNELVNCQIHGKQNTTVARCSKCLHSGGGGARRNDRVRKRRRDTVHAQERESIPRFSASTSRGRSRRARGLAARGAAPEPGTQRRHQPLHLLVLRAHALELRRGHDAVHPPRRQHLQASTRTAPRVTPKTPAAATRCSSPRPAGPRRTLLSAASTAKLNQ